MLGFDSADAWFQNWVENGSNYWEEFREGYLQQIWGAGVEDVVEEFMRLRQENSVVEY